MNKWFFAVALLAGVVHADTGTLVRATELKHTPSIDAERLASLDVNTPLELIGRQGAWLQVKTRAGVLGWVKMLNVRTGSGEIKAGSTASGLRLAAASFNGGGNSATATTGVRGLTEEELRTAQANPEAFSQMKRYASTPAEAATYAREARLQAQKSLPYLAAPAAAAREE